MRIFINILFCPPAVLNDNFSKILYNLFIFPYSLKVEMNSRKIFIRFMIIVEYIYSNSRICDYSKMNRI